MPWWLGPDRNEIGLTGSFTVDLLEMTPRAFPIPFFGLMPGKFNFASNISLFLYFSGDGRGWSVNKA
jgi:hypothetical protein